MLDIGWTEIVVIAVVAILVVGPKDLPRMLRGFGQTLGQLRRTANDFKRQFDDALREAEREADLEDTRKQVKSLSRMDPLADVKKGVEKDLSAEDEAREAAKRKRKAQAEGAARPDAGRTGPKSGQVETPAEPAKAEAKAEPAKAEEAEPAEPRRDSDAA